MFQHKTIAEAKLKGAIRTSFAQEKELIKEAKEINKHSRSLLGYKKGIIEYIALFKAMANERILYEYTSPKRTSWHHKCEFITFAGGFGSSVQIEEVGRVLGMILHTFNTRRIIKRKEDGHSQYALSIYIQEHFFVRYLQRIGALKIGEVGSKFYPVIEWLLSNNVPLKHIPETCYFVFSEYIFVGSRMPYSSGLLIKTVLTSNAMTEHQRRFFSESLAKFEKKENLCCLLVNEHGSVIRSIPQTQGIKLASIDASKSNWLTACKEIFEDKLAQIN